MFALKSILVTSLIASTALAHFTLDYPVSNNQFQVVIKEDLVLTVCSLAIPWVPRRH